VQAASVPRFTINSKYVLLYGIDVFCAKYIIPTQAPIRGGVLFTRFFTKRRSTMLSPQVVEELRKLTRHFGDYHVRGLDESDDASVQKYLATFLAGINVELSDKEHRYASMLDRVIRSALSAAGEAVKKTVN